MVDEGTVEVAVPPIADSKGGGGGAGYWATCAIALRLNGEAEEAETSLVQYGARRMHWAHPRPQGPDAA